MDRGYLAIMATQTLLAPEPTPSCRVDYLAASFKLPTIPRCEDLLDLGMTLGHHVLPNGEEQPPRPSRLYQFAFQHDSGVTVEFTEPESGKRNEGTGLLTVPGSVFAALTSEERLALYREVYLMEGFYRCTRIDTQLTVLDPPVNIYGFVDACQAGDIWAKGFSSGQPYTQLDRAGNHRIAPTWYFGTADSPTRARIYSHGVKHDWSVEDLRLEVQQRKRNADDTFRALYKQTLSEKEDSPLLLEKEANLVKAVSREKLDLRNTTGVDREQLGGKWLRKSPRVGWYAELVDAPGAPVERRARPVPTLHQTLDASVEQYGGSIGAWIIQTMAEEGCTLKQASEVYAKHCIARMRDQHRQRAKVGLEEDMQHEVDRIYSRLADKCSQWAESAQWG